MKLHDKYFENVTMYKHSTNFCSHLFTTIIRKLCKNRKVKFVKSKNFTIILLTTSDKIFIRHSKSLMKLFLCLFTSTVVERNHEIWYIYVNLRKLT